MATKNIYKEIFFFLFESNQMVVIAGHCKKFKLSAFSTFVFKKKKSKTLALKWIFFMEVVSISKLVYEWNLIVKQIRIFAIL